MFSESDRERLRGGFDEDALAFDRTRPVCPAALFDDLLRVGELGPGDRAVEIGAGTGQATVPLAERGLGVTAIELGRELAAVARTKLARFPAVEVVTSSFEDWEPAGRVFDAVVAVNSLHWVDPQVRYAKPAQVLRPGGVLAVVSCNWARPTDAHVFWRDVQDDYAAVGAAGEPPPPPEDIGPAHLAPEAQRLFDEVVALRYPFTMNFSSADYLANLNTQTVARQLGDERRAEFLARVGSRLDRLGRPEITATFVGLLTVGRAR